MMVAMRRLDQGPLLSQPMTKRVDCDDPCDDVSHWFA